MANTTACECPTSDLDMGLMAAGALLIFGALVFGVYSCYKSVRTQVDQCTRDRAMLVTLLDKDGAAPAPEPEPEPESA